MPRARKWSLIALAAFGFLLAAGLEPFGPGGPIHEIHPDAIQSGRSHGQKRGREDWAAKKQSPDLDALAALAAEQAARTTWTGKHREAWKKEFARGYMDAYTRELRRDMDAKYKVAPKGAPRPAFANPTKRKARRGTMCSPRARRREVRSSFATMNGIVCPEA